MDLKGLNDLGADVRRDARLSDYTTFRLGGRCPYVVTCQEPAQLEEVVLFFARQNISFLLIGGGSNLVVSDGGVTCPVVRYVNDGPLVPHEAGLVRLEGTDIVAAGSTNLDALAFYAAAQGLDGLNCATGIPGTVGGGVAGNVGAFGKQVGDCLKSVTLISRNGVKKNAGPDELEFSYRDSVLKRTGGIVLEARFSLSPSDKDALLKERQEILNLRRQKHPDLATHPCAGSFFRNIEPTSRAEKRQAAGWFLEKAGAKELRSGGASVFEKHANIIVNPGKATAQDVFDLSRKMAQSVKDKFNIDLIREVRFVGEFEGVKGEFKNLIW